MSQQLPTFRPDRDANPFHTAPAVHKHKNCSKCGAYQRNETFKHLLRCAGCGIALYCSKECQQSDWPQHKDLCKDAKAKNKDIEAESGIVGGYSDFIQWVEYYATPMKNCMVAALNLREYPHQQRNSALFIRLNRKENAALLPLQHRFTIDSIDRLNRGDTDVPALVSTAMSILDSPTFKTTIQRGKSEFGNEYYGTCLIMILSRFPGRHQTNPFLSTKIFSIDKRIANAGIVSVPWWTPLRHIMETGGKMRFCCSKLGTGRDCCCGGWTHHVETS